MKKLILLGSLLLIPATVLIGCSPDEETETANVETETINESSGETGTLALVANGEDFVRQGFVTKDGWQIDFDHVYVTLEDVTAYQTDPPFDPDQSNEIKATEEVTLLEAPQTVDLAEGEADAEPILVTTAQAPKGTYNAISWNVVKATEGEAAGSTIWLEGTATKAGETVNFVLSFDSSLEYTCGQYVGDARKGILTNTEEAELETTFHFDHIFGDADAPADDDLNVDAVGFDPFANLAENGTVNADMEMLQSSLSDEDYSSLVTALEGLGHVGEGHCQSTITSSQ